MEHIIDTLGFHENKTEILGQRCLYDLVLYPTKALYEEYRSPLPEIMAWALAVTFSVMAVAFFIYDRFVRRRNKEVVDAAARSGRIVCSLFPANVRDRLLAEEAEAEKRRRDQRSNPTFSIFQKVGTTEERRSLPAAEDATDTETDDDLYETKPIADLFPDASVLFADIAGFTAWSSAREPSQVFILLETVFRAFDE